MKSAFFVCEFLECICFIVKYLYISFLKNFMLFVRIINIATLYNKKQNMLSNVYIYKYVYYDCFILNF